MTNLEKELKKINILEKKRLALEEKLKIKRLKDFNQKRINVLKSQIKNTENKRQALRTLKRAGRYAGKAGLGAGRLGISIINKLQQIADEQNKPVRRRKKRRK